MALPTSVASENKDAYLSLLEGEFRRLANFALISKNPKDADLILSELPDLPEIKERYNDTFKRERLRLENEITEYESQV